MRTSLTSACAYEATSALTTQFEANGPQSIILGSPPPPGVIMVASLLGAFSSHALPVYPDYLCQGFLRPLLDKELEDLLNEPCL